MKLALFALLTMVSAQSMPSLNCTTATGSMEVLMCASSISQRVQSCNMNLGCMCKELVSVAKCYDLCDPASSPQKASMMERANATCNNSAMNSTVDVNKMVQAFVQNGTIPFSNVLNATTPAPTTTVKTAPTATAKSDGAIVSVSTVLLTAYLGIMVSLQ